jgi:hypothetical protein
MLVAAVLALAAAAALYFLLLRQDVVVGEVIVPVPSAMIGSGSDAVAVGPQGQILDWLPPPAEDSLPRLPLSSVPEKGVLGGTVLEQARVLGAAPARLRPYLAQSTMGDSGVDVILRSGIELRFGDASRAAEKWKAAAAVLASPTTTSLDYVDLTAPARPALAGSGHTLPPVP